jgi:hypothetical protein
LTNEHGRTIPLKYVNAEVLVSLFRVAERLRFFQGSGFRLFFRSMANKLIGHYGGGHLHFITITCYRRLPLVRSVRARNVFVELLGEVRDRQAYGGLKHDRS